MTSNLFQVKDKVAVITGSGRGIGAATAVTLAEAGADVVITSRTEEDLTEVAARVAKAGRKAHVVRADLSDPQAAADLAHAAVEVFGRLDIVVNNVGGSHPRPLLETTTDFLEESFRFNVSGAHALTTAAAPYMLEAGGGAIVNISSLIGRVAGRGWAAYGTAKAALSHYTRLAALDLAPRIRVNAIEPGSIATSVLDGVGTPEIIEKLESEIPLRRLGDPEHIAATVLYLVSPAGAYVTGKILEVDGGSQLPPAGF